MDRNLINASTCYFNLNKLFSENIKHLYDKIDSLRKGKYISSFLGIVADLKQERTPGPMEIEVSDIDLLEGEKVDKYE